MATSGGSKEALERAIDAAREAGDAAEEARFLRELAALERGEGHDWRARRLLERALEVYRETNDLRGVTAVMGELEPVAEAEGQPGEDEPRAAAAPPAAEASDIIRMRPTVPASGARLSPPVPPGGSRREGTSWPVAIGFLLLLLAVAGGITFLAIRLVGDFLGDGEDTEISEPLDVPVTVEPSPAITRLPADNGEKGRPLTVTPQSCDLTESGSFVEVAMRVRIDANEPFQVVVLRGSLTARRGGELGFGIMPVTPVERGKDRVTVRFTVFEELPSGRLTCGVEIQTAVPQF